MSQMPHAAFDILLAMAKPGGHIVFSVGEWNLSDYGYADALKIVDDRGDWDRLKEEKIAKYTNMDEGAAGKFKPTHECLFVYKKKE